MAVRYPVDLWRHAERWQPAPEHSLSGLQDILVHLHPVKLAIHYYPYGCSHLPGA
jgi:hypothetical protein